MRVHMLPPSGQGLRSNRSKVKVVLNLFVLLFYCFKITIT